MAFKSSGGMPGRITYSDPTAFPASRSCRQPLPDHRQRARSGRRPPNSESQDRLHPRASARFSAPTAEVALRRGPPTTSVWRSDNGIFVLGIRFGRGIVSCQADPITDPSWLASRHPSVIHYSPAVGMHDNHARPPVSRTDIAGSVSEGARRQTNVHKHPEIGEVGHEPLDDLPPDRRRRVWGWVDPRRRYPARRRRERSSIPAGVAAGRKSRHRDRNQDALGTRVAVGLRLNPRQTFDPELAHDCSISTGCASRRLRIL